MGRRGILQSKLTLGAACAWLASCEATLFDTRPPAVPNVDVDSGVAVLPPQDTVDPAADCSKLPGVGTQLIRLTKDEYLNTLRDITGLGQPMADSIPDDPVRDSTVNEASSLVVRESLAFAYRNAAEAVSTAVVTQPAALARVMGCSTRDDLCAQSFIRALGRKAFRRPLTALERTALFTLFKSAPSVITQRPGFEAGVQLVLEALFLSPNFIYRVEADGPGVAPGIRALTSHEAASRLSYFYLGSAPDDALLDAADATPQFSSDQVSAQARRLLQDPRARRSMRRFFAQWLGVERYGSLTRDAATFPLFTANARAAMAEESLKFLDDSVFESREGFSRLFTSPKAFLGRDLAPLYGLAFDAGSSDVELNTTQRAGILTRVGFLASHAQAQTSSPIQRGVFVLRKVLCRELPEPPPNAFQNGAAPTGQTTRERTAALTSPPACRGCHGLINPIGFAFEGFDAVGQHRTTEQGVPVDTTGRMMLDGREVSFHDAVSLSASLSASTEARECMAKQLLSYTLARKLAPADHCAVVSLGEALKRPNYRLLDFLADISQTQAFQFRADEGL